MSSWRPAVPRHLSLFGAKLTAAEEDERWKTVLALIDKDSINHDILYQEYFSNHMVHLLLSAWKLGASSSKLTQLYAEYSRRLRPPRPSTVAVTDANWIRHRGEANNYATYLAYFTPKIGTHPHCLPEPLIHSHLVPLLKGLAAEALHPLIHLGFATEFDHPVVMAEGMAYLADHYYPLGDVSALENKGDMSAVEVLQDLGHDEEVGRALSGHLKVDDSFLKKVEIIKRTIGERLINYVGKWRIASTQGGLEDLNKTAFYTLTSSRPVDFFLVHGLTSSHALRSILLLLPSECHMNVLRNFLLAMAALYVAQGRPAIRKDAWSQFAEAEWEDVRKGALDLGDDHVVKVVAALKQWENEGLFEGAATDMGLKGAKWVLDGVVQKGYDFNGVGWAAKL